MACLTMSYCHKQQSALAHAQAQCPSDQCRSNMQQLGARPRPAPTAGGSGAAPHPTGLCPVRGALGQYNLHRCPRGRRKLHDEERRRPMMAVVQSTAADGGPARAAAAQAGSTWPAGRPTFGVFVCTGSAAIAEGLAHGGVDWLCLDMQHGAVGYAELLGLLQAAASAPKTRCIVRVGGPSDRYGIQQALE